MRRTSEEVARYIESYLYGPDGLRKWDAFASVPIADKRLDAIRLRCVQLGNEAPDVRFSELEGIVRELRWDTPPAQR